MIGVLAAVIGEVMPHPCLSSDQPSYHISNMGTGPHDGNAVFQWHGVWHVMHQANWTDWAHLVSTDLVHWTRLKSALAPNGDWDGALSILADGRPVILFDCYDVQDCNGSYVPPHAMAGRRRSLQPVPNDHPLVGVAHPANLSDPNLTEWRKDPRNPIQLFATDGRPVTRGFAGPSNLFAAPDGLSFIMQYGTTIARLRSAEPSLHNWTVAQPAFYPSAGHGGRGASGLAFYPLPGNTSDAPRKPTRRGAPPNAWLGNFWPSAKGALAGTQWVVVGRYANGSFTPSAPAQRMDGSDGVVFGTMQCSVGRCLHVGWFNYDAGCLTVPRELSFEHSEATGARMLAMPVAELVALRSELIGRRAATLVEPGDHISAFDDAVSSRSFDLDAEIEIRGPAAARIDVAILTSSPHDPAANADVLLTVRVSPEVKGVSQVDVLAGLHTHKPGRNATISFNATLTATAGTASTPDPGATRRLPLRILADKTIVEIFVDGGRGVVSAPVLLPKAAPARGGVYFAGGQPYTLTLQAWEMGCGWSQLP